MPTTTSWELFDQWMEALGTILPFPLQVFASFICWTMGPESHLCTASWDTLLQHFDRLTPGQQAAAWHRFVTLPDEALLALPRFGRVSLRRLRTRQAEVLALFGSPDAWDAWAESLPTTWKSL